MAGNPPPQNGNTYEDFVASLKGLVDRLALPEGYRDPLAAYLYFPGGSNGFIPTKIDGEPVDPPMSAADFDGLNPQVRAMFLRGADAFVDADRAKPGFQRHPARTKEGLMKRHDEAVELLGPAAESQAWRL